MAGVRTSGPIAWSSGSADAARGARSEWPIVVSEYCERVARCRLDVIVGVACRLPVRPVCQPVGQDLRNRYRAAGWPLCGP